MKFTIKLLITCSLLCFVGLARSDTKNKAKFTEAEKVQLEKFRPLVSDVLYLDYMKEDDYLIRWIRDQNSNLDKANTKLRQFIAWRKEKKIDGILDEDFSDINRVCPIHVDGHDKELRPIVIMSLGQCDIRKLALSGLLERAHRNIYYALEKAAAKVREARATEEGKGVNDVILIFDVSGFNLRQHGCLRCLGLASALILSYEQYYPEYLYKVFFLNVPRSAQAFLNFLAPFASPKSYEIGQTFGHDKQEWSTELLSHISPDQLPVALGGTKKA